MSRVEEHQMLTGGEIQVGFVFPGFFFSFIFFFIFRLYKIKKTIELVTFHSYDLHRELFIDNLHLNKLAAIPPTPPKKKSHTPRVRLLE